MKFFSWLLRDIYIYNYRRFLILLIQKVLFSLSSIAPSFSVMPRPLGIPNSKSSPASVHISSPQLLMDTYKKPQDLANYLKNTRMVCFDEADQILTQHPDFLKKLRTAMKKTEVEEETQFVFCGATLAPIKTAKCKTPRATIEKYVSGITTISTVGIHTTPALLEEIFINCEDTFGGKFDLLLTTLRAIPNGSQALIFVNSPSRVISLHKALQDILPSLKQHNIELELSALHGDMQKDDRTVEILRIAKLVSRMDAVQVIVCTDVIARGVDFRHITHVIQFDFAREASEYLHRVGRTCRGDEGGKAVAFVGTRDVTLAGFIEDAGMGVYRERLANHEKFFGSAEGGKGALTGLFSRKRSFSK